MRKFGFCTENLTQPSELSFLSFLKPISKDKYNMIYGVLRSSTREEIHGAVTSVLLNLKSPSLQIMMIPEYVSTVSSIIEKIKELDQDCNNRYYLYGANEKAYSNTKVKFEFALSVLQYYQSNSDALNKENMNNLTIKAVPSLESVYYNRNEKSEELKELMNRAYRERCRLLSFSQLSEQEEESEPTISNADEDMKTIGGVVYFLNALDRLPMIAHYAYVRCSADKPWISKEDNAINSANYKSLYKYCNQPNIFLKSESSAEHIRTILREQFGIKDSAITKVFNDVLNKKKHTDKGESK